MSSPDSWLNASHSSGSAVMVPPADQLVDAGFAAAAGRVVPSSLAIRASAVCAVGARSSLTVPVLLSIEDPAASRPRSRPVSPTSSAEPFRRGTLAELGASAQRGPADSSPALDQAAGLALQLLDLPRKKACALPGPPPWGGARERQAGSPAPASMPRYRRSATTAAALRPAPLSSSASSLPGWWPPG